MEQLGCILCQATRTQLYPYVFTTILGVQYEVYFCLNCNRTVMTSIREGTNGYQANLDLELAYMVEKVHKQVQT